MSHYTIDYGSFDNEKDKREQAIKDIVQYLGQERFDAISVEISKAIAQGATLKDFYIPLGLAGVQGYPVEAWYEHCKTLK